MAGRAPVGGGAIAGVPSEPYSCAPKGPAEVGITVLIFIFFGILILINAVILNYPVAAGCGGQVVTANGLGCADAQFMRMLIYVQLGLVILVTAFFIVYLYYGRKRQQQH
jgi:hypothetical protein